MFKWIKDKLNIGKNEEEEKLESFDEELENSAEDLVDSIDEGLEELEERKEEFSEKLEDSLEEEVDELSDFLDDSKEELAEKLEDLGEEIGEFGGELKDDESGEVQVIDEDKTEEIQEPEEFIENNIQEENQLDGEESFIEESEEALEEDEPEQVEETQEEKKGFFAKLKDGLTKTRDNITEQIDNVLNSFKKVDEELFEELEEILITSDVGIETTMNLIDTLRDRCKDENVVEPSEVIELLKEEIKTLMLDSVEDNSLNIEPSPAVILVVGVNGVGKTTTIGKMANMLKNDGKKVLIAAGDTFRAAAIEQLEEWGNRANVDIISHSEGSDPGAVIYDGIQAAKARKTDVLICDTAGRLHNKSNLMNELNKIFRIVENEYPEASKEVLLVLDATTGQNAMSQAKTFKEVANITGIALTKLDGTAKGGVVIALQAELGIPIKYVGVGEGIDDLQPFNSESFIDALFD